MPYIDGDEHGQATIEFTGQQGEAGRDFEWMLEGFKKNLDAAYKCGIHPGRKLHGYSVQDPGRHAACARRVRWQNIGQRKRQMEELIDVLEVYYNDMAAFLEDMLDMECDD